MIDKIGTSRLTALSGQSSGSSLGTSARVSSADPVGSSLSASSGDAVTVALTSSRTSSQSASYSGVKDYLSVRENAASNVADLRAEQAALAEEGATLAEGEELSNLQTRFTEITDEITRIKGAATYNGQNVLSGAVFGENNTSDGVNSRVISVSNLSALTADPGLSLSTPDDAAVAADSLETLAGLSSSAAIQSSSALSNASTKFDPTVVSLPEASDRLSVESARNAESRVLSDYTSSSSAQYSAQQSTKNLIDSLISGSNSENS